MSSDSTGLEAKLSQCSLSFNRAKGTLRGMHYQAAPHAEAKVVSCMGGAIYDVIIDLRPTSPTFRQWFGVELSAENHRLIYIPRNCAHGFLTLQDNSAVYYQSSGRFVVRKRARRALGRPRLRYRVAGRAERDPGARSTVSGFHRMSKRVLLTGASGFIGSHCIGPLVTRGYECTRSPAGRWLSAVASVGTRPICSMKGNAPRSLRTCGRSHLLHIAWYAVPGKYWNSAENLRWVQASLGLMQAFAAAGGRRLVMAGTCAEYDWSHGRCTESDTPLAPTTLYGTCKHALQIMLAAWCGQVGLSSAWGRVFSLYGPGEHPQRLIASVISSLLRGEDATCNRGGLVRDYLHVADVADAFVALRATLRGQSISGLVSVRNSRALSR